MSDQTSSLPQPPTTDNEFVIRPNCSLSWRAAVWFFVAMLVVSFAIAGVFAFVGAWLILPFAGLEMLVLGTSLYLCLQRGHQREVISIRPEVVEVSRGRYGPRDVRRFSRTWVSVRLTEPGNPWYPSRLILAAHGREVEVGRCLNGEERRTLARELREALQQKGAAA